MFGPKTKDMVFFDAFTEHAKKSVEAAKLLVDMFVRLEKTVLKGDPYRGDEVMGAEGAELVDAARSTGEAIKKLESEGDAITHATVKRLHNTWITPLDREDIHGIVSRLDDVLDMIEAVAERVMLFQVTHARPEAAALARVLVKSCEAIHAATTLLPTLAKSNELLERCVEINRLENEADTIYREAIAALFKAGNDPLTVMKWRDIFDNLETATDRCEDVANIIEGVVLEYA